MAALDNKNIFLVEDDASNQAVISALLRSQGAVVHFDRWGVTTVDHIRKLGNIDLILLDLMLPKNVSGYDVFDQLRLIPELAAIPIILVTAADPALEMNKAREKGFNGYISKPIRRHKFINSINAVLRGETVWDAGE